ncbi:MAG: DUF1761 domain-containing protein [Saprospiraceae bacterium]|nr:DUF1761 domain-containing protein [Saprospiraceae bacterium]
MESFNFLVVLASGLVPLAVGAIWYGPLFGKAWMAAADMTMEKMVGANMMKIYGLALLFGLMLAVGLFPIVVHQMGIFSTLQNVGVDTPGSEANLFAQDFISKYGTEFRTYKHGAFHGFLTGLFVFLPIMATNALFERKSWKYIFLNVGYWTLCAAIMGGIISAWA